MTNQTVFEVHEFGWNLQDGSSKMGYTSKREAWNAGWDASWEVNYLTDGRCLPRVDVVEEVYIEVS